MEHNNINIDIKQKKKKQKKIFSEEELARTLYYKELAIAKRQSFSNKCTCPKGFKGDGAFCPIHRD